MGGRGLCEMGAYQASEESWLYRPFYAGNASLTGRQCLVYLHGRMTQAHEPTQWRGLKAIVTALVDAGYVVMGIDAGSNSGGAGSSDATSYKVAWNSDIVIGASGAIANAKTYLLTTLGANGSTKIGLLDWSLGGGQGFTWMANNSGAAAGVISFAPAADYGWMNTNFLTTNSGGAAEMDLAYAATKTTTTGSGTLNQVGSNVTIASGTGFAASGTFVLYTIATLANYATPVKVTYTGGGGTTTLTGCTIASGSRTWGTGTNFTGVATTGGWATNASTRDPMQVATAGVFDSVPVHVYLAADDASVGRATTPIQTTSMGLNFTNTVGANATFHSVRGRQYATTNTTITDTKTISTSTTLNLTSAAAWPTSGNGVIEVGTTEPFVFAYTGKSTNQLTGVTAVVPTSQAVTSGQVAYASSLDGHLQLHPQIDPAEIVGYVKSFSW